jgi:5-methylcytosine-specific restriction endonuclease McrA
MSNYVFVIDTQQTPQTPVHPAVARRLLTSKQAAVWRRYPFTIILKTVCPGPLFAQPCRLKIDPGAKTTGLALLQGRRVVWTAELTHRGQRITDALAKRRAVRRGRRQRTTRYRPARLDNRTRPAGWLPPSLHSRVENILTWVSRVSRLCHLTALSQELVRFDTQLMQHAKIAGAAYQQGTLAGYELREYLLEKWRRTCAYCGATEVPLEVEHIIPKSRGGTDRVSNLTLACVPCNRRKGNQTAAEFWYPQLQAQAKQPLKAAAAVNSTRWALYHQLQATGLPVEAGTGGRTKYNRTRLSIPKSHWGDAACVGASTPDQLAVLSTQPLRITAVGRGRRQVVRTDKHGFPRGGAGRVKRSHGFSTGDIVRLVQPRGKYAGIHIGMLAGIRTRGDHDLKTQEGKKITGKASNMRLLQRADGYAYA